MGWLLLALVHFGSGLSMDVYGERPGRSPAVLWVHGGGWHSGDRHSISPALVRTLTARGYVVASPDFRQARFPVPLNDLRLALARLKSLPCVDPRRVALAGASSGGHLAALLKCSA